MPLTDILLIVVSAWGFLMVATHLINAARTTAAGARTNASSRIRSR